MPEWLSSKRPQIANVVKDMEKTVVHPYGRKRRGTEEPLDESERGE